MTVDGVPGDAPGRGARERGDDVGGDAPGRQARGTARPSRGRRSVLAAAVAAALMLVVPTAAPAAVGDTSVFARIGPPGYPAHAYVHPDGRVYEGTYVNHGAPGVPSKVLEFAPTGGTGADRSGTTRSWTVPGQDVAGGEQGVQVATSDARGRLLLLDRAPARALLLDRDAGTFSTYTTFPDLKPCSAVAFHVDCEPGGGDERPMPNYALWLPDGGLLVTDYQQDVIWRVPAGGGRPAVWLGLDRFGSSEFGLAGLALTPDRTTVLATLASNLGAPQLDMLQGKLLAIPLTSDLLPGTARTLWTSGPLDLPDGIAVSKAGNVYVALVGGSAQVVQLSPAGGEVRRFGVPVVGLNGSPIPFDGPSSVRFQGSRLLVANQSALLGVAANQAILAVESGETGVPELIPPGAGEAPVVAAPAPAPAPVPRLRVTIAPKRLVVGRRTVVRLRVTATVGGARRSVPKARIRLVGRSVRTDAKGRATLTLRRTTPERLKAVATATGYRAGTAALVVRRR